MRALSIIHKKDIIHRDISPDNIMIDRNRKVKLIDFGAAKKYGMGSDDEAIVLKYGYAPIEQYSRDGRQGPWTDVYSLCATMYYLMTGKKVPDARKRQEEDTLLSPAELNVKLEKQQNDAIIKGLAIQPGERFQTMEELYFSIYGGLI